MSMVMAFRPGSSTTGMSSPAGSSSRLSESNTSIALSVSSPVFSIVNGIDAFRLVKLNDKPSGTETVSRCWLISDSTADR